ncbi:NAD-dependent DNA ligase LigA [Metamycoplasma gateae]|uniref:DNA ligase n=1 Tax=Metamycoplasma gateae TaxID=35769 RepID=A0ABZ2AHG3_9BACT|nr:NAD-dependent DNA ligase LigA [Metamycoplasma gateae]
MDLKYIEIKKKIIELQKKISEWDKNYYDLDNPSVSDAIYDIEFNKLKKMEEDYFFLFSKEELQNSPTNKVNAHASNLFTKVEHKIPMLSLNKAYTIEEIKKFIDNIKKVAQTFSFFIEPKIDGLSISIKYEDGQLVQGITRGSGTVGEDVTNNILQIKNIPKKISYKNSLEVRGEIFLPIYEFNKLNKKLESEEKPLMANPRNAASGTLRQINSKIVRERNLSSFIYYVVNPEEHNIETMEDSYRFLKNLGFNVSIESKRIDDINQINDYIEKFKYIKQNLDYETDGIVIKLNELKYYDKLGYTSKFPHSAIAFKYEPDVSSTILKDIFITIGRTGLVTYNAALEEVELSGTKVNFATLNNYDFIKNLNVNIGDEIYIKKAGEIIPCVIGISNKNNLSVFKPIKICPFCKKELFFNDTGLEQYCLNENCPEIETRKIIHFASKEALDITGLGSQNIISFKKNNFINSIIDIFKLKNYENELVNLEGFGTLSISKILNSIEESKNKSLEKWIFALSIPLIGQKTAKFIASKVLRFENLLHYDFSKFEEFHDIGSKITNTLINWFGDAKNQEMINNFINIGINPIYIKNIKTNKLDGLSFVITGKLSKPRSFYERIIIENGGQVLSAISSKVNYLLAGESAGSKLTKAKKNNIEIINENTFNELLD